MAVNPENLSDIAFDIRRLDYGAMGTPEGYDDIPSAWWTGAREVIIEAFSEAMPSVDREAAEEFVGPLWEFERVHRDPNILTQEGRVNPQQFSMPTMAVALHVPKACEMPRVVGAALSANATSGSTPEQRAKKAHLPVYRYRWLEKVGVLPEYQGRGIGSVMTMMSLRSSRHLQPASAYTWPDETDAGSRLLESIGMTRQTGSTQVSPFGPDHGEVTQVWYRARSARAIAKRIMRQSTDPGELRRFLFQGSKLSMVLESLDREHLSQKF